MTKKRFLIILLLSVALLGCIYLAWILLQSVVSVAPGEKLTTTERKIVRNLENTYKCNIKIYHDTKDIDESDSVMHIYFFWRTKEGEKTDAVHNITLKDDGTIIRFSNKVVQKLTELSYNKKYKTIYVSLEDAGTYNKIWTPGRKFNLTYDASDGQISLIEFRKQ